MIDYAREAETSPLSQQDGRKMAESFSFVPGKSNPALAKAREEAAMRAQSRRAGSSFDAGSSDGEE